MFHSSNCLARLKLSKQASATNSLSSHRTSNLDTRFVLAWHPSSPPFSFSFCRPPPLLSRLPTPGQPFVGWLLPALAPRLGGGLVYSALGALLAAPSTSGRILAFFVVDGSSGSFPLSLEGGSSVGSADLGGSGSGSKVWQ